MSFFSWAKSGRENAEHSGRNLQDGLFQIASQACHILVQVNNTHNISYGGSNTVTNVAYSKYPSTSRSPSNATSPMGASASSSYPSTSRTTSSNPHQHLETSRQAKDQDVVVLLPHRKSRTPRVKHKLSTVSENARLETTSVDDELESWDQTGFMLRSDIGDHLTHSKWGAQGWCRPSCIPISIILILIVLVVLLPLLDHAEHKHFSNSSIYGNESEYMCKDSCRISLVESIPIGLIYDNNSVLHRSTYSTWVDLIQSAQYTIEIASLYWTMTRQDVYPDDSAREGEDVFEALLSAGRDRNIEIKIAQNAPSQLSPNFDTEFLTKKARAEVRSLNFAALLGGGVLHTKLWLIDRTHVYVGSANMDWRSLTQVKELGVLIQNCTCLANDFAKIFEVYWQLGKEGRIPPSWPDSLKTKININNPINLTLDDSNKYKGFIASSPAPLSPIGRSNDIDAILYCIEKAEKFVYISVMDYVPLTIYTPKVKYWPVIDDAIRSAAIDRRIRIKLLISWWKHSRKSEDNFLRSLMDLTNSYKNVKIDIKRFIVPTNADFDKIPYGRVNHNKYMVTDAAAYIGTSNWSGDYFIDTAGIGFILEDDGPKNNESIRKQLEDVFLRDWNSPYAHPLNATPTTATTNRFNSFVKQKINYFLPFYHHHIRA
ncbi:5'-3' exonuclease PLD3-like isoform X1 [Microplitis mediator]|uniref:5'-3' exonuclease PLD3-like isoform X1 n=1 Tax=Microplitis mediator TaxID=375433 RepID=UPI00255546BF|nr:5'-3' exonuclease PLD3-like isoform X1 [Microplitis mediator]